MSKKYCLYPTGKTIDGKITFAGVYTFYETFGLPLCDIINALWERNCIPSWLIMLDEMEKAGMKKERAIEKIVAAILESTIPFNFADQVIERMRRMNE